MYVCLRRVDFNPQEYMNLLVCFRNPVGSGGGLIRTSMPIKSSGRIVPPGWAPLQPKQSVLSLIV